jgi:hypothetical protein
MLPYPATTIPFPNDALQGLGDRLDRAVLDVAAKMKELQAIVGAQAQRLEAVERQAADLERELAISEARLAVEMMHSAGLAAQAAHMMAVAIEADMPVLSELTEEREVEGTLKSRLAQIYEAAFDTKAAELGIEDPARFRQA